MDLGHFALSDMVSCGSLVRAVAADAESMEQAATRIVRALYEELTGPAGRNCVLVRFYKTHPFDGLTPELQAFARQSSVTDDLTPSTRCLTLLATAGDVQDWNDRRQSHRHQAIPLQSAEIVDRSPMIAQMMRQFGLDAATLLAGQPADAPPGEERAYNVFYVPDAVGSPDIPAQDFVTDHGVQSVLGFGGTLPDGDLFSVILFSRTRIEAGTAEMFAPIALSARVALLRLGGAPVFQDEHGGGARAPFARPPMTAVEQLLEVQDRIAQEQSARLERTHAAERRRSRQLQRLAQESVAINSSLSPNQIIERATASARDIVDAHQAVGNLSASDGALGVSSLSLSDRYDHHRDFSAAPDRCLEVPLATSTGEVVGTLTVADAIGGAFTDDDHALLVQLAALASISIENARRYEREHSVAVALQHSLLPDTLLMRHRLGAAARYLPATHDMAVGGDWYDVLHVSAHEVVLVVGDVVGHDLRAAKSMGRLRHAIAAYASEDHDPATVFTRVNRLIELTGTDEEFATACYMLIDLRTGVVRSVNAGHPPPLIVSMDGASRYVDDAPAPPLGFATGDSFNEASTILSAGEMLLLYTDGLVERRGEHLDVGLDRLRDAVATGARDAETLVSHVETFARQTSRADDVALLVAQYLGD